MDYFIIVLGSSKNEVRKLRVQAAVNYFQELNKKILAETIDSLDYQPQIIFIFCGKGGSKTLGNCEAENMYKYATETLGVDPKKCIIEKESMNTHQNIQFAKNLLEKLGWFQPTYVREYKYVICTSTFHSKRAGIIANNILPLEHGKIELIHTNEVVSKEEEIRETNLIYNFLKNEKSKKY